MTDKKGLQAKLTWVNSISDKTTGVIAIPGCLTAGDVFGDGNFRIVMASQEPKLICFEGQSITHEVSLPDLPSSLCFHYNGKSTIPLLAVGAGNNVLFYLNMRPNSKFNLPPPFHSDKESKIYQNYKNSNQSLIDLQAELKSIEEHNISLCSQSYALIKADLSTKSENDRFKEYIEGIFTSDIVTCLAVIPTNAAADNRSTRLLIGTESRSLLLLDASDMAVEKKWELDAPPSVIKVSGSYSGSSLIVIVTRDRNLRFISNLNEKPFIVRLPSLPVDVAIVGQTVYAALMSRAVKLIDTAGKIQKEFINFSDHLISMQTFVFEGKQIEYACVATASGNLYFLHGNQIVTYFKLDEGISSIFFGKVGREPNNLLTISKYGGLFLRTFIRIQESTCLHASNPSDQSTEQDKNSTNISKPTKNVQNEETQIKDQGLSTQPLPIPKKSQLFVDQCKKEQSEGKEMYEEWENSISYLNLIAADTYSKILTDAVLSPLDDITFSLKVSGMGPRFVLEAETLNTGKDVISGIKLIPQFNSKVYRIKPTEVNLPPMIGGCNLKAKFFVESIDKDGKNDIITVTAVSPLFSSPIAAANIQIPVSQFPVL